MKNTIILNIATLLLIVCFSIPAVTYAQDGLLDLSFDTDGIVTTAIGTSDDFGRADFFNRNMCRIQIGNIA